MARITLLTIATLVLAFTVASADTSTVATTQAHGGRLKRSAQGKIFLGRKTEGDDPTRTSSLSGTEALPGEEAKASRGGLSPETSARARRRAMLAEAAAAQEADPAAALRKRKATRREARAARGTTRQQEEEELQARLPVVGKLVHVPLAFDVDAADVALESRRTPSTPGALRSQVAAAAIPGYEGADRARELRQKPGPRQMAQQVARQQREQAQRLERAAAQKAEVAAAERNELAKANQDRARRDEMATREEALTAKIQAKKEARALQAATEKLMHAVPFTQDIKHQMAEAKRAARERTRVEDEAFEKEVHDWEIMVAMARAAKARAARADYVEQA